MEQYKKRTAFVCEKNPLTYQGGEEYEILYVPHISKMSWATILKALSIGSPITLTGCSECNDTPHLKKLAEVFENNGYKQAFNMSDIVPSPLVGEAGTRPKDGWGEGVFSGQTIKQIFVSSSDKIPFPETGWVDIGERCTLCQNCTYVCPTGALTVEKGERRLSLIYKHDLCKGCPFCEKACPERCISIDRRVRLNKVWTEEKKCEREIWLCKGCGKSLGADAVLNKVRKRLIAHGINADHLGYCGTCKSTRHYSKSDVGAATFMGVS